MAEATDKKGKMNKWVKFGLIAFVVIIVVVVLYMLFKPAAAKANKYASADSIAKAKSGTYAKWADTWDNAAIAKLNGLIPGEYSTGISKGDAFGRAWLKGMDLDATVTNVDTFSSDISAYGSASFKKAHWEVTKGSFLSSTATA